MSEMTITALVPWYGSNRMSAPTVGRQLVGCSHITIPFAGSMCEVPHMPPKSQLYVCDLHDDLINLAEIVANDERRKMVAASLATRLFHPKVLAEAQVRLRNWRARSEDGGLFGIQLGASEYCEEDRAADFFTVAWMSRNGTAGTDSELNSGLSLRSCGYGGDPTTRYRNAIASLEAWGRVLGRCQFARESCWDTLARVAARARALTKQGKEPKLGVYCDAPWPDDGDRYKHAFTETDQRRLAADCAAMPTGVRVVIRFGDHPLIRELYPEDRWTWVRQSSRSQANGEVSEVLILNGAAK